MDNQRCDASSVPGKDLEFENRKLKEEIESLKSKQAEQEVEKLKLENQILKLENQNQRLVYENENLKKNDNSHDKMRDSGELKEEVEKLKEEVEGLKLKSENQLSNQQPIKAKSNLPKLVTKMDRLIEGVSRFIEGIEPKTKEYDSYVQWYDDMLERMENGCVYDCQKYLLFCGKDIRSVYNLTYHSYAGDSIRLFQPQHFFSKTLKQGWTHENTKLVCILHPENPQQFIELDPGYIEKDTHSWSLGHCQNIEACSKNSGSEKKYSLIFCCIKK